MSLAAFFLVLFSAILHAGGNFLCKKQNPDLGFMWAYSITISLILLPLMLYSGISIFDMPAKLIFCMAGGAFFGYTGVWGLVLAYRREDISKAYPLMRALPVLLVALGTAVFRMGKPLGALAVAGMFAIFSGCILMTLPNAGKLYLKDFFNKGMLGILIGAFSTTGYTLCDGAGVRILHTLPDMPSPFFQAVFYSCFREFLITAAATLVFFCCRPVRKYYQLAHFRAPQTYVAAAAGCLAYVLVLAAMGLVSNVSYVQAFRQLSLPIGMLLGFFILKEKATVKKAVAIVFILIGLTLIVL